MRALLSEFFINMREADLKLSTLVICEILVVFANTLAADDKYPVGECDNLRLLIQMQLS